MTKILFCLVLLAIGAFGTIAKAQTDTSLPGDSLKVKPIEKNKLPKELEESLLKQVRKQVEEIQPTVDIAGINHEGMSVSQGRFSGSQFGIPAFNFQLNTPKLLDIDLGGYRLEAHASSNQWRNAFNTLHDSRTIGLDLKLRKDLSWNTSFSMGQLSSIHLPTHQKFGEIYTNLTYTPSQKWMLTGGVAVGSYMGHTYINPRLHSQILLSRNLKLYLDGGASLFTAPYSHQFLGQEFYGGARLQYITDAGVYFYGSAGSSFTSLSGYFPHRYGMLYSPVLGGGLGYNIPGCGPVEVGVAYRHNPITNKAQPEVTVNVVGALIWIVKGITKLFE
ncbi:MAG: hypothetical protein Q3998_03495 [Porphyromonas sp.]|nr:hypothetical protein [Porphyromonas sp.]